MKLNPHITKYRYDQTKISSFGLIIYTDEHPNIKKALRDEDYWRALDKSSGEKWVIFSARAVPGSYRLPEVPRGSFGMMIPIWEEPEENRELLDSFELDSTKELPRFLVFTKIGENEMLQSDIKLRDDSVDDAFDCLRSVITHITSAVEKIDLKNRENTKEIFYLLEKVIDGLKFQRATKKVFDIAGLIKKWIP